MQTSFCLRVALSIRSLENGLAVTKFCSCRYYWNCEDQAVSELPWAPVKHGLFTVRSAYWFAMDEFWSASTESTSSSPDGNRKVWDLIWQCDVPPKVQHFAWRLVTNSLPTWINKHKRNLEVTDRCPICGVEGEVNFHPFFRRTLAKELWTHNSILPKSDRYLQSILLFYLAQTGCLTTQKISMILKLVFGKATSGDCAIFEMKLCKTKTLRQWRCLGDFSMSYMDSLTPIKHHLGEEIVKGNHSGAIIVSACRQLFDCRDVFQAELSAVLEGVTNRWWLRQIAGR
jgi:hypothetical protein